MKQIIYSNQEEKISKQVEGLIEEQERILAQAQKAAQNCPEGSLKVQKKESGRYYYKRSAEQDGKVILQYLPKKNQISKYFLEANFHKYRASEVFLT